MGYLLLAGAGLLGYLLFSSKAGASGVPGGGVTPPLPSPGDQLLATQATNTAQQFNLQAQALGLTQAQAQDAYSMGLSPLDYVNSGMAQGASNPYGTG